MRGTPRRPRAAYELRLLGGFAATRDARPIRVPAASQRLVALAALYGAPLPRSLAAERLWPHLDHASALGSLRTAVSRLRRHHPDLLAGGGEHVLLAPTVAVDVHAAEALATRLSAAAWSETDASGDAPVVLTPLTQTLLPDLPDDWVALERERLQDHFLHAIEAHAARLSASGRYAEALAAVHAALAADPVRESAAAALITIHIAERNRGRALLVYREFCERLRTRLGIDPSPEFHALVAPIVTTHG